MVPEFFWKFGLFQSFKSKSRCLCQETIRFQKVLSTLKANVSLRHLFKSSKKSLHWNCIFVSIGIDFSTEHSSVSMTDNNLLFHYHRFNDTRQISWLYLIKTQNYKQNWSIFRHTFIPYKYNNKNEQDNNKIVQLFIYNSNLCLVLLPYRYKLH